MKIFQTSELEKTLEDLAAPYTSHRSIQGPYVMAPQSEIELHKSDLSDFPGNKIPKQNDVCALLATKAISGTLKPTESARLIFECPGNPADMSTEDAALVYGALRHCLIAPKITRSTFFAAKHSGILNNLLISTKVEDPGCVLFELASEEYSYEEKRRHGVAGHLLAMQKALLDRSGIQTSARPQPVALPNLRFQTIAKLLL